jgi:type I restriction enzyme, S subunit
LTIRIHEPTSSSDTTSQGWAKVRFDAIAENIVEHVEVPSESGYERFVGGDHLDAGSLKISRWGSTNDVEAQKLLFKKGHILFGKRNAYLRKVAYADFDGVCSAHMLVLQAKSDYILEEFLPFFMQTDQFWERALMISEGSMSPTIKWKTLAQQEFVIPPKDEQRQIADILWGLDVAIVKWQAVVRSVNEVLYAIREHSVCAPTHQRHRLGVYLKRIAPGRSVLGMNSPANDENFGVLKVSAVGTQYFEASENKQLLNPDDFRPEFQVRAGDFLITRCNTRELVGKVCIVPKNYNKLMLCDKTLRLDFAEYDICKEFILEALRSRELRTQIEAAASGTGGAMKNISQEDIRELKVPIPPIEIQRTIVSLIQQVEKVRYSIEIHLAKTIVCRRTLLHQMLAK